MTGGLDREAKESYLLNVSALDGGIFPQPLEGFTLVNITLEDANDNPPVFSRSEYTFAVHEHEAAPTTVGRVSALDADIGENGRVTYFINDTG